MTAPDLIPIGVSIRLIRIEALAKQLDVSYQVAWDFITRLGVKLINLNDALYFSLGSLELALYRSTFPLTVPPEADDPDKWVQRCSIAGMAYGKASTEALEKRLRNISSYLQYISPDGSVRKDLKRKGPPKKRTSRKRTQPDG